MRFPLTAIGLSVLLLVPLGCESQPAAEEAVTSEMMKKWPPERVQTYLKEALSLTKVTVTKKDATTYVGDGVATDGSRLSFSILVEESGLHCDYTTSDGEGGMMSFGGEMDGDGAGGY